jgi:hypothetical protein
MAYMEIKALFFKSTGLEGNSLPPTQFGGILLQPTI